LGEIIQGTFRLGIGVFLVLGMLVGIVGAAVCDGPPNYVGFNFAPGSGATGDAPFLLKVQGVAEPSLGGDPVSTWYWDFGDGSGPIQGSGTAYQNPSHLYLNAGTYTVTYRAATLCNIWTTDRTYPITVNPATTGITINPVTGVNYGDIIPLSGTDTSGGTTVHLQMEGPSIPMGTKIADVPIQGSVWTYAWDTSTLPGAGTYTVWAFTQQYWQSDSTSINLMAVVTPIYGKISVSSSPSGATAYLDGTSKGTTPLTITSVTPGTHTLDLTLAGYQDYSATISVTAGQIATLSATLTPILTSGGLSITSTPSGATILGGNGVKTGVTPMGVELLPGSHVLKLQKAGYAEYTGTFTVVAGKMAPVTVQLVALPQTTTSTVTTFAQPTTATGGGTLTIQSIPTNAAIRLDGVDQGMTPKSIPNLKAGAHTVIVSYPGYHDWTGTVTVVAGATMPITITLIAKSGTPFGTPPATVSPSGTGSLIVQSVPEGANVYLNGERVGVTPVTLSNVTPGIHRILLTYSGYSDYQETVQVSVGAQSVVTAQMTGQQASPGFEGIVALIAVGAILILWHSRR
jgi:PEGA domain./PKD domain.